MDGLNTSVNTQVVADPVQPVTQDPGTQTTQEPVVTDPAVSVQEGTANPQQEVKPVQTPDQNALFAKVRREAEQKAQDKIIADMYGQSHGIYTYADYQKAIAEQQRKQEAAQKNIDPEFYNQFLTLQDKVNSYEKNSMMIQQEAELSKDPVKGELFNTWKEDVKQVSKDFNVDYNTAFTLLLGERLGDILGKTKAQAEQEAINKITTNGQTTPGPLGVGEVNHKTDINSMSKADFEKMLEGIKRGEITSI